MASCVRHITLEINCGLARCAIRELTPKTNDLKEIDTQQRASEFKQLFSECTNYGIDETYFKNDGKNGSLFNRGCTKLLQPFKKKWHPKETRCDYEKAFSIANWKGLPLEKKQLHTLAKCKACHKQYPHLQLAYPQGPYYEESVLSIDTEGLHLLGEKKATRQALAEINTTFTDFQH